MITLKTLLNATYTVIVSGDYVKHGTWNKGKTVIQDHRESLSITFRYCEGEAQLDEVRKNVLGTSIELMVYSSIMAILIKINLEWKAQLSYTTEQDTRAAESQDM